MHSCCRPTKPFPFQQEDLEMVQSDRLAGVLGEWECMECGYIEEGNRARRPKRCPECDAPASALDFFPYNDDADSERGVSVDYDEGLDEEAEDLEEEEFEEESEEEEM
jgi:NAD-dependent SIR2 family protein deacetylase